MPRYRIKPRAGAKGAKQPINTFRRRQKVTWLKQQLITSSDTESRL